ncbi:DUF1285 domain-containing protein [Parahaliea mediterranea]|uniref:DUF1285 domain-containing protein n=1 Tax=Parahaliea mediterranea TaxID=651086 RepID=A0A939DGM2_9GAMM|nr:DUF1285 domain-containing protein [Parahaliea mediterranea]MBN7797709.1 DUF1285 domain-containing protein [Parahaliea mediterranea]
MPEPADTPDPLRSLERQVKGRRNFDEPPIHLWNPPLSGDIDIEIRADGSWWHEGDPIRREAIVRLFASILRREDDGEYYLVTPAEKWRLRVEAHPLTIIEIEAGADGEEGVYTATLNTGKRYPIDAEHPLFLDRERDGVAGIRLPHGLSALCTRPAWYRLVEQAEEVDGVPAIRSSGNTWPLA